MIFLPSRISVNASTLLQTLVMFFIQTAPGDLPHWPAVGGTKMSARTAQHPPEADVRVIQEVIMKISTNFPHI